jgi:cytoskeletal protein RodZ
MRRAEFVFNAEPHLDPSVNPSVNHNTDLNEVDVAEPVLDRPGLYSGQAFGRAGYVSTGIVTPSVAEQVSKFWESVPLPAAPIQTAPASAAATARATATATATAIATATATGTVSATVAGTAAETATVTAAPAATPTATPTATAGGGAQVVPPAATPGFLIACAVIIALGLGLVGASIARDPAAANVLPEVATVPMCPHADELEAPTVLT